tara:strand:+ start:403 stop:753 length:351 start_codon:yes stop_codon:yes gene_type:complete
MDGNPYGYKNLLVNLLRSCSMNRWNDDRKNNIDVMTDILETKLHPFKTSILIKYPIRDKNDNVSTIKSIKNETYSSEVFLVHTFISSDVSIKIKLIDVSVDIKPGIGDSDITKGLF